MRRRAAMFGLIEMQQKRGGGGGGGIEHRTVTWQMTYEYIDKEN